ncbi:AP protein [bacterium]|nr:MAG: AP protein [bacterium]
MVALSLLAGTALLGAPPKKSENVVVVLMDGMRWQEVFGGLQQKTVEKPTSGVKDPGPLKRRWDGADDATRRKTLMPFLWDVVSRKGVIYGDRRIQSRANVANTFHFSYPGYSETIVGFADPRIDSNADKPNPNVSVLEWLNRQPGFQNRVAVFGGWNVVSNIVAKERSGLAAWSGLERVDRGRITERQRLLNDLKDELHHPGGEYPFDAITFESGFEYLKANRPRAMWITMHDTDEFGHAGEYGNYLEAAHKSDGFIRTLWNWVEATPGYRGRTTLIVAPDHGRGNDEAGDWRHHGNKNPGSDEVWIAAMGPSVRADGTVESNDVKIAQIAASIARALGFDYSKVESRAMPPLPAF